MGVPRLFKFICDNFPEYVQRLRKGSIIPDKLPNIDYLYLDANGLLHGAAQEVHNYGTIKRMIDPYHKLSLQDKNHKVYEIFFDRIMFLVNKVTPPTKVLYIAIDGPAPIAKQAQQRQRRFVAGLARDATKTSVVGNNKRNTIKFNSSCITPGTVFMHELECYMTWRIRNELNYVKRLQGVEIIFSPPTVPGEGEHKLMDYIRSLPPSELENSNHCLFGPDGDLIMLTLATHLKNIYLLRDDISNDDYMHIVNMGGVREKLTDVVGGITDVGTTSWLSRRNFDDFSNDFILQGFFVGNDFLPKIQMFYLLEEGMNFMLDVYTRTPGHLTIDNRVNLSGFKEFIKIISGYEEQRILDQHFRKRSRTTGAFADTKIPDEMFIDKTLEKNVKKKKLDFVSYRVDYYHKANIDLMDTSTSPVEQIKQICMDYLKTMVWVLDYYVSGLPDWRWCYNHHYPPLMTDLYHTINNLTLEEERELMNFELGEPSPPFVQLLSVLPTSGGDLLPKEYRKLMVKSKLVKAGYYPSYFHIDYEGKLKEYQGVAILPFVDREFVTSVYSEVAEHGKEYIRNKLGKNVRFVYDKEYSTDYKSYSKSGGRVIKNLHVRRYYM